MHGEATRRVPSSQPAARPTDQPNLDRHTLTRRQGRRRSRLRAQGFGVQELCGAWMPEPGSLYQPYRSRLQRVSDNWQYRRECI